MPEIRNARSSVRVAFQNATNIARVSRVSNRVLVRSEGPSRVAQVGLRVLTTVTSATQVAAISLRALMTDVSMPSTGAEADYWAGTEWISGPVSYWDGSGFVDAVEVKIWNGTAFV